MRILIAAMMMWILLLTTIVQYSYYYCCRLSWMTPVGGLEFGILIAANFGGEVSPGMMGDTTRTLPGLHSKNVAKRGEYFRAP